MTNTTTTAAGKFYAGYIAETPSGEIHYEKSKWICDAKVSSGVYKTYHPVWVPQTEWLLISS